MTEAADIVTTLEDGEQLLLFPEAPRPKGDRWLVRHYWTPDDDPDRVSITYEMVWADDEDGAYAQAQICSNLNMVATRLADGEEPPRCANPLELWPIGVTSEWLARQEFKRKFSEGLDLVERALTTLDSFIAEHEDPGTEALDVSWCLGKLLDRHGRLAHRHHEATLRGPVERERLRWAEAIDELLLLPIPEPAPEPSLEATLAQITQALKDTTKMTLLEAAKWADEEAAYRRQTGGSHAANLLDWVGDKLRKRALYTPERYVEATRG